ncbi:DUF2683 family protein [archaeon]|jgi:uncharacterized protein|nr:DUF2683 family protein [archaeon]MBT4351746.1 DUF2683 family protein [archaeon]MBT4647851.1 DUF2683 family protein [archaeon]MBT6821052.1 DUF2683 family protein [archaeon]MBT7392029.1 DUF2683 family protein [archaeon]
MVNALIKLNLRTNKILNVIKAINDFNDKGETIEFIVEKYIELEKKSLYDHLKNDLTAEKILKKLQKNKIKLQKLGIKKIGLFGSYLRGEQKKDSDIDLLVELNSSKFDFYMETKFYLEDLLKKRVDLVEIKALKKGVEYVKEEAKYVKGL